MSVVARQFDVNANQVFVWRRRFCATLAAAPAPQLMPVVLTPDRADTAPPPPTGDIIEIELSSGHRLRVAGGVKAASLRLVLDVLERR